MKKFVLIFFIILYFSSIVFADCSYDLVNSDSVVDIFDLVFIASNFDISNASGSNYFDPSADVDGSGEVDITDLILVVQNFGECDEPPSSNCNIGSLISSECSCSGSDYSSGYCCVGGWQVNECVVSVAENECTNGLDDDGDGLTDFADTGGSSGIALGCVGPNGQETSTNYGWTLFEPSVDSKIIYISASGNDSWDGLSPDTPKATIEAGYNLLRDGYPDWLLLKRGDEWNAHLGYGGNDGEQWYKSGRSETEMMLVATYGASTIRPLIYPDAYFIESVGLSELSNVAFMGIQAYRKNRDPDSPEFGDSMSGGGINFTSGARNILFEDLHLNFSGITMQSYVGEINNIRLRRSIIQNTYTTSESHVQGLWATGTIGKQVPPNEWTFNDFLIEDKEHFLLFIKERAKKDYRIFPMVFKDAKFIGGFIETQTYLNQELNFDENENF